MKDKGAWRTDAATPDLLNALLIVQQKSIKLEYLFGFQKVLA